MNRHKIFNGLALTLSIVIVLSPMTALSGCKEKGALGSEAQSLARYMPADTALFASIQVSDEAIDVLDGLLGRVAEALPPDSLPPGLLSVRSVFEQGVASLGYDYETDIRSWLGDWVAVGVGDVSVLDDDWMLDPNLPNVIAISVTDRGKAEAFIDRLLADSGADRELQKTTEGDFTAYRSPSPDQPAAILLGDEVLLLGTSAGLTAATGDGDTLIDAAAFADTMDLLQASSYNMLVYLDTGLLTNLIAADLDSTSEPATAPIVGAIIGALGPTALGVTALDDRSLAIDIVQQIDKGDLEALGFSLDGAGPTDLDFAANIPASASLVVHGANLKALYNALIANLRAAANQGILGETDVGQMLSQIDAVFTTATGLDLQADILDWMTGDYALFVSYDPTAPGASSLFIAMIDPNAPQSLAGLDIGLVIEATDAAQAQKFAEEIGTLAQTLAAASEVEVRQEQVNGADATVISLTPPEFSEPMEFVIGANDKVFVAATRAAAMAILGGEDGLDRVSDFTEAKNHFLADAALVWYVDNNGLNMLGNYYIVTGILIQRIFDSIIINLMSTPTPVPGEEEERIQREIAQFEREQRSLQTLTSLVSSSSLSTAGNADGDILIRFVLTLSK